MYLIAHLSDPHIGPIPQPKLRELVGKRMTGYVNWRRGRKVAHDMTVLERLIEDMRAHKPDHIAFTGDIANIGLASEFPIARAFLERLGSPDFVSFVPGNHDAYVRGSLKPLTNALWPWMASDGASSSAFPYLRRRDGIAFIGLSSAVPTMPFVASGTLGKPQLAAFEAMMDELDREGLCRVVMLHLPPLRSGAAVGRSLTDAAAFEKVIARVGAEVVLHGHNHRTSLTHIKGKHGPVPVVGVPSCSAVKGTWTHRAGYHLISIEPDGPRSRITGLTRGLTPDGNIAEVGKLDFSTS